jgi:hypothetical protein
MNMQLSKVTNKYSGVKKDNVNSSSEIEFIILIRRSF